MEVVEPACAPVVGAGVVPVVIVVGVCVGVGVMVEAAARSPESELSHRIKTPSPFTVESKAIVVVETFPRSTLLPSEVGNT